MSSQATSQSRYADAAKRLREITNLEGISGLLGWDEMVMIPTGSSESRAEQKAALTSAIYDRRTDPVFGDLLSSLQQASAELDDVQKAVVRDAAKDYRRSTAVPKELAQQISRLESTAYEAWVSAKKDSDWSKFEPSLKEWVEVSKAKAKFIDPDAAPYDTLLDMYEKGMTSKRLDEIFTEVRDGVVPLLKSIKEKGTCPESDWLIGDWDLGKQAELCRSIALDLGFSLEHGRLDVSVHPFTGGTHPTDVRMTTRFKKDDLTEGLTGAIHETGHSLYEQGRNLSPDWKDLPVNVALSMGVHESQSLLWERMVGLSRPFQHYLLPKIKEYFPSFAASSPEALYLALNVVKEPSYIRVEADELTYVLHIILRYEIERGLMQGDIEVSDVPRVWNEKSRSYLGIDVPDDKTGCLQDVHFSAGLFGYFPTYFLGAAFAVQIYDAARAEIPRLEDKIAKGEFAPLKAWLNEKIHRSGSFHPSGDALMVAVTGKPLDPAVFLGYLRAKYTDIYKL